MRKWLQKLTSMPSVAARWTTIRLATDASSVKLPARVEAMAMTSQARCGSAERRHKWLQREYRGHIADEIRQQRRKGAQDGGILEM